MLKLYTLDQIESKEAKPTHVFGEIEVKAASEAQGKMQMSGYVSVKTPDLGNDIVEPEGFRPYLHRYFPNNPIYLWHHDPHKPIGHVKGVSIDSKGVYLEDITLSDVEIDGSQFVRKFIWVLVKDGVLKQQSIGFIPMEGKQEGKFFRITLSYLLESSLVSVAMNPDAFIDTVKSQFKNFSQEEAIIKYKSMDDLMTAVYTGEVQLRNEHESSVFVDGFKKSVQIDSGETEIVNKLNANEAHPMTPDFGDVVAIRLTDDQKSAYDKEGSALPKPRPYHKNFRSVSELIHAAKSESRGSYMFEIGYPTEKGFAYDWDRVALSMCKMLGAKGGAYFMPDQKMQVIERIAEAYTALEKQLPQVEVSLDNLTAEKTAINMLNADTLAKVKFQQVEFLEGEHEILDASLLEENAKSIENIFKKWKEAGGVPENAQPLVKEMWAMFNIYGWVETPEDVAEMQQVMEVVAAANQPVEEQKPEGAYAPKEDAATELTAEQLAAKAAMDEKMKDFLAALRDFNSLKR